MPRPNPAAALTSSLVRADDILDGGLFIWQNTMYRVLPRVDKAGTPMDKQVYDEGRILVQPIAKGWTGNPYDRWQYGQYSTESFQGDCVVAQLLFKQDWEKDETSYVNLSNSELAG